MIIISLVSILYIYLYHKQKQIIMKNLTAEQKRLVETLINLGDSKELAIKTALNESKKDNSLYQIAYYS